ncbi:MAG: response regulator [Fibrobacteres bacterium]|nr:response regulator [Fibrobacterota bacterium]
MKPKSILCVDDEPYVLNALRRLLRMEPVELICAGSAEEGLAALAGKRFDVIVSDYIMPGKNGVEFLAEARKALPESHRILLTGHGDHSRIEQALGCGDVHEFFTKPWDSELLKMKILS